MFLVGGKNDSAGVCLGLELLWLFIGVPCLPLWDVVQKSAGAEVTV